MTERKWCPADWMDEMPPALSTNPSDFLKRNAEGVLQLYPLDAANEDPEDIAWQVTDVKDGDVVQFLWTERRGSRVMTIQSDGSWTVDEPFPEDTNCFDDEGGNLFVVNTLEDAAKQLHEQMMGEAAIFPVEVEIDGWVWSDDVPMRLRAMEGGTAVFEAMS